MADQQLLAYEREHHGDPYMTLAKAKEMQRVALQFWHLGAAKKKADRDAQEEARRRLHEKLSPSDSAVTAPRSPLTSPTRQTSTPTSARCSTWSNPG
jgi:hypothetical protein